MGPALLAAALAMAGAPLGWEAQLRAEGREGTRSRLNTGVGPALQLEPVGTLLAPGAEWGASLSYAPRLLLESGAQGQRELLHRLRSSLTWKPQPTRVLLLSQEVQFGDRDFSPLNGSGGPPSTATVDPRLSQLGAVPYVSTLTSAGWEERLSRTVRGALTASYQVSGGETSLARTVLPLQRSLRAEGTLTATATREDDFSLWVGASRSSFSLGTLARLGGALGLWRRHIGESTVFELGGGAAASSVLGGQQGSLQVRPAASLGVLQTLQTRAPRFTATAHAEIRPAIDSVGGTVVQRAEARGGLELAPSDRLRFGLTGSGARNLSDGGNSVVSGEFVATWMPQPVLGISAGVRALSSNSVAPGAPVDSARTNFQSVGFLVLTVNERGIF